MPEVSLIATLVATLVSFFLGGIWYGPLCGKAWMEENHIDAEKLEELKKTFNPAKTYGLTLVLSVISAYVFGMFLGPKPGIAMATGAGFAAGVAWVASSFATTYLWESRTTRHLMINGGYHAVRFTLIGLSFGVLG
jgi:hypothetical protein